MIKGQQIKMFRPRMRVRNGGAVGGDGTVRLWELKYPVYGGVRYEYKIAYERGADPTSRSCQAHRRWIVWTVNVTSRL
jgi:hypothetical protein